jgi:transposase
MIGLPRGVEVFMYGEPCDMRRSFNTLSMVVQSEMKRDLMDGDLFLFVGKDRRRAMGISRRRGRCRRNSCRSASWRSSSKGRQPSDSS